MFNEAQRRIFQFFNGSQMVYADPLRIYRRLQYALEGEVNKYLRQARSEDINAAYQAEEKLLSAGRYALEMPPCDPQTGQGALEQDIKSALRAYLEFMEGNASGGASLPACSLATRPLPPSSQTSPTPIMSPFGATSLPSIFKEPGK